MAVRGDVPAGSGILPGDADEAHAICLWRNAGQQMGCEAAPALRSKEPRPTCRTLSLLVGTRPAGGYRLLAR